MGFKDIFGLKKKQAVSAEETQSEEMQSEETQSEETRSEETVSAEDAVSEGEGFEKTLPEGRVEEMPVLPYDAYRYRWIVNHRDERLARRKMKFRHFLAALVSVILALGFLALVFAVFYRFAYPPQSGNHSGADGTQSANGTADPPEGADAVVTPLLPAEPKTEEDVLTLPEIVEKIRPSVVCIEIGQSNSFSSGVIVKVENNKSYILTNRHVIASGETVASDIQVYLHDGSKYAATQVASDKLRDVAVLSIEVAEGIVPAEIGNSDLLRQGDTVVAIGTPGSLDLAGSATRGIVSGTARRVPMEGKIFTGIIQMDASINPGNSGGPLVNVYGEVVGITSMKFPSGSYESIGFALPSNGVMEAFNVLRASGRIAEPLEHDFVEGSLYLGATFEYFTALEAEKAELVAGAYVKTVDKGGPAEKAGIKMGDIITVIDGVPVDSLSVLESILAQKVPGDVITFTVYRDREHSAVEVTLGVYNG